MFYVSFNIFIFIDILILEVKFEKQTQNTCRD